MECFVIFVMAWCWCNATESKPQNVSSNIKDVKLLKNIMLILKIIESYNPEEKLTEEDYTFTESISNYFRDGIAKVDRGVKKALEEGNLKEKFETFLLITSETFNNIEDEELRKAKLEEEFNKDFVAVITKEIEDISIPIVKKYFDKLVAERSDLLAIQ